MEKRETWSENQEKYIRFLARGKKDLSGKHYTNEEFAKLIGVNPNTLYNWKKLPGFKEAYFEQILAENADHLPALMQAQLAGGIKRGKGGETPAAQLVLKAYGLLIDRQDHTTNGKDLPTPVLPINDLRHD